MDPGVCMCVCVHVHITDSWFIQTMEMTFFWGGGPHCINSGLELVVCRPGWPQTHKDPPASASVPQCPAVKRIRILFNGGCVVQL